MSLGVLNNLSAMYAENNLNNTTNSLNTVLQQLSSGSKINSGADDAAGLSLVDGLQANSVALAQSQTNAQEGVGLLQVADGALSQVTSLLNRAVTLATEASNGTLNSSQDTAANQEYQSILSEINNIGTTTTYNDTSVFGQAATNIYTGDSSTAGASIDSLNISSLSSSNVGDTGGVMAYSNGQSSVFLNLSTSTQNAQSTDTLNSAGTSTLDVSYLVKGADGASTPATTSITVGGTNAQPNTAQGMINAINNAGLGLTATFSTAAQSGAAVGGTETGIQISGGIISVGVDPNTASTGGTLNPSEITSGDLALGQVISVNSGSTNVATFTTTSSNDTLDQIAAQINAGTGHTGGSATAGMVTATVVYNSAGQETSLQLNDGSNAGGALTVTATPTTIAPSALTSLTTVSAANSPVNVNFSTGGAGSAGQYAVATLAIPGGTADNNPATNNLTGSIEIMNGGNVTTFHLNDSSGDSNTATNVYITAGNSSLNGLAAAIQGSLGLGATTTASATTSGITITSTQAGTAISTVGTPTLAATLGAGVTSNVGGLLASSGTDGSTSLSMVGDVNGFSGTGLDALATGTQLVLTNGSGSAYTFTMGTVAAGAGTTTETTGGLTTGALLTAINSTTATSGMSAAITGGKIVISSNQVNTSITAVSTLTGLGAGFSQTGSGVAPTIANQSAVTLTTGVGAPATGQGSLTGAGTTLTGDFSVSNNGNTTDFIMSTGAGVALGGGSQTLSGANSNMAGLMAAINADAGLDLNATLNQTAGGAVSGLTLTATNGAAAAVTTGGAGLAEAGSLAFTTPVEGGSGQAQSALLALQNSGVLAQGGTIAEDGTVTGSISITTTTGGHTVTDTFNMGSDAAGTTGTATVNGVYNVATNKLSDLMAAVNQAGTDNLDLTATQDAGTGGIFLQSKSLSDTGMGATSNTLSTSLNYTASSASAVTYTPAVVVDTNGGVNNANDLLENGAMIVLTGPTGPATTFVVGGNSGVNTIGVGMFGGQATLGQLATAIAGAGLDLNATAGTGGLTITSTAANGAGTITVGTNTLKDDYSTGTPVVTAGSGPTTATSGSASINTGAGMSTAGTDALGGSLVLQNGSGTAVTFNLNNTTTPNTSSEVYLTTGANSTTTGLMNAINAKTALGITASINSTTGALQLQSNTTGTAITATSSLTDATNASALTGGAAGNQNVYSKATISLADSVGAVHNSLGNTSNPLTGNISITANGNTIDFIMGGTGASNVSNLTSGSGTVTLSANNSTVAGLKSAIVNEGASLNVSVGVSSGTNGLTGDDLLLTSNVANGTTITSVSSAGSLQDTLGNAAATANLGSFASASDIVSGNVDYTYGTNEMNLGTIAANKDVTQLVNFINTGSYGSATTLSTGPDVNHVHASLASGANGYQTINLTSDVYGSSGDLTNGGTTGTSLTDHPTAATLTYFSNNPYNVGVSNVATSGVYDSSIASESHPAGTSAAYASLSASRGTSAGIATISYSDGAGQSLSATDLSNQTDAETSLTALNKSITDVAAQDGYIGAQINTLNAVSSVLSTQQENVVSAQNAVQATDYASATSNMSKYEILSQTGISALAQANSMSQEVTKLLQ
jgi:flagellin